ncbi:MAG: PhnD/SsuA/transferrin family substrate-binding protein [Chloroflexi bacterium]|nr:PhnD/SsuA/transferrin family substrate-binding protein [Chloroflexota bacterium]
MPLMMSLLAGALTQSLLDGSVRVRGFDVVPTQAMSVDANSRQMLNGDFDVAEMSLGTYLKGWEKGADLIGLPIFTGRRFLHGAAIASKHADISKPEDLRGKTVGLPQFWQTSSIWHRGILQRQHGVSPESIVWFTSADERFDGLDSPPGIDMRRLPSGWTIDQALESGDLDAALMPSRGSTPQRLAASRPVFANADEAEQEFFEATGVFPIMHFLTVRRSLATPELAKALTSAFEAAKSRVTLPPPEAWSYGLEPNHVTLETFLDICVGQRWLAERPALEDLFLTT